MQCDKFSEEDTRHDFIYAPTPINPFTATIFYSRLQQHPKYLEQLFTITNPHYLEIFHQGFEVITKKRGKCNEF